MINTLVSRASSVHVLDDVLEMLRARRLVVDVANCPIQRLEYTTHSNTDPPCQIYTLPPNNTYSGGITFSSMPSGCPSVRPLSVVNTYHATSDISLLSEGILMKPVTNYRAAWNADAVLRWEFCLSVRLSVCLSVCLTVRLSNACIVTKRKKNLSRFLYHAKDHLAYIFWEEEYGWWGDPFDLKFFVNRPPLERNRRFSTDNRSWRLSRNT